MKKIIIPTLILFTLLSGCKKENKNINPDAEFIVNEQASLRLPLDSTTTQAIRYLQLINDSCLAFLNKPTSEILLYSLREPKCEDKIKIYREGPNAVHGVEAFYIQNPDSIWLYAYWDKQAYLIDKNGTLKSSLTIPSTDETVSTTHSVSPYPMSTTPYVVKDGIHFLQGMDGIVVPNRLAGASLIYNQNTGEMKTGTTYPALYGPTEDIQRNWSTFGDRHTHSYVTSDSRVITSFPMADSIYVWNPISDIINAHPAAYSKRPTLKSSVGSSREKGDEKYVEGFQYGAILYDSTNKLYYRLFRKAGNFDKNDIQASIFSKPLGVIILNDSLEKIGETLLPPGDYYPGDAFVNSNGLHVNTYSEDDDFLVFKVFKFSPQ